MKYSTEQMEKMRAVRICTLIGRVDVGTKVTTTCPFHNPSRHKEKSPSFYVYPDNSYNCFSCGKNGQNAIDFISSLEGVELPEALEELSKYI